MGHDVQSLSRDDGDLRHAATWRKLRVDIHFDAIYFCAEKTGNQKFHEENSAFSLVNANSEMLKNLEQFMRKLQYPSHLYSFGSLWTAGRECTRISEEDLFSYTPEAGISALRITKILLFELARSLNLETRHHASIITTGTLYGPGDNSDHLVPSVLRRLVNSTAELELSGDGNSTRNYLYIKDLCYYLNVIMLSNYRCPENLIVSSEQNYRVIEVINFLANQFDVKDIRFGKREDQFPIRVPNVDRFNSMYKLNDFEFTPLEKFKKKDLVGWL